MVEEKLLFLFVDREFGFPLGGGDPAEVPLAGEREKAGELLGVQKSN